MGPLTFGPLGLCQVSPLGPVLRPLTLTVVEVFDFFVSFHQGQTSKAKNQKGKRIYHINQGHLWGPNQRHHHASLSALQMTPTWCDVTRHLGNLQS